MVGSEGGPETFYFNSPKNLGGDWFFTRRSFFKADIEECQWLAGSLRGLGIESGTPRSRALFSAIASCNDWLNETDREIPAPRSTTLRGTQVKRTGCSPWSPLSCGWRAETGPSPDLKKPNFLAHPFKFIIYCRPLVQRRIVWIRVVKWTISRYISGIDEVWTVFPRNTEPECFESYRVVD